MEAPSGLSYTSFQGSSAQPSSVSYPVSKTSYSPSPDMSSVATWNSVPAWDPSEESTTTYTASRTSQPTPDLSLPPPLYQAGELEHYEESSEFGNSERETEDLSFMAPPPSYPGPDFQAGELSHYESSYEHGNEEREMEEQGFMPVPPYEMSTLSTSEEGPKELYSQDLRPVGPDLYYLFLTGQLSPGTLSHFQSEYETGNDHWNEDHYERYHFPIAQSLIIPTETKEVPEHQPQDYTKA